MAGWDSYTQKATPEDNDTLMIKDATAGANKRTPFSGVWNWMLNKLANAVISQLETSNKSIIPAINELNSKTLGNIAYYDANTDHTSETARSQALIQVLNQFKNNNTNTYLVSVIRYYNGYYFTYVASIQSGGSSFYVLEYSASMSAINIWNVTRTLNSATITRRFSDDATLNQVSEYTVPKPEDNDDISYGDPCYIYVKKSGSFVNIQLNILGTVYNTSGFITLFTLNEGYRPISGVIHNYISQGGIPMLLNITTSGNVQIHCPGNTITNSWIIRQCITFPCAA